MIALPLLLLVTDPTPSVSMPAIAIDPCVEVDAEEVRRLAALELSSWQAGASADSLAVTVTCEDEAQELRLIDRVSGRETVRNLDLSATSGTDRDAKTRELALAIAELLRRAEVAPTPKPEPAPRPVPASVEDERKPLPPTENETSARPFRLQLGVAGRGTSFTGGEVLMGLDVNARTHFGPWLVAELRVGGNKTRPVALENGRVDATGMSAAAGLALDVVPFWQGAGVAVGTRLGVDWLRYAAIDHEGVAYGGRDAGALTASGVVSAFAELSESFSVTGDAAVGGALHSIAIRDNGKKVSGLSGILFSGAVGVAASF